MVHRFLLTLFAFLLAFSSILALGQEAEEPPSKPPCSPCGWPEGVLLPLKAKNGKYGFVNTQRKFVIAPRFEEAGNFSEGLAAVRLGKGRIGKWGYVDEKGRMTIPAKFDSHSDFREGLAAVQVGATDVDEQGTANGGKWGYIDKTGKFVVRPRLRNAYNFSDGLAAVEEWNAEIYRDAFGAWAKQGFINRRGVYVVKPEFENVQTFREGLSAVRLNGKYGFIDTSGRFVIPAIYDFASSFGEQQDGWGLVGVGDKSFLVNKEGKLINKP